MPLRLKFLELQGYKTFAAKTSFEFAEGITAIVGPNGSGKSNIADALRWVLGEQSYSLLRAKKTEDMIFAGSEQKPRAGMASATVTFDNADGWLPVDFSEVALARRAYRDGRNEYFLNSQHVRLRDINELLARSGLSERTYTILGQGLVDASLALKADERRRLFEEAAGIGLYRARREETLRRLETTQRNLDRVLDILAELEPRLKSLERQAARAQEYAQVQADLRVLLREWYGYHWHKAQQDLSSALEASRRQEAILSEARAAYQGTRQKYASFRDNLNGLRARLNSWHRQSALLHEKREATSGDLAVFEERQRTLLDSRRSTLLDQGRVAEEVRSAREQQAEVEKDAAQQTADFEEAQTQSRKAQALLADRQAEKTRCESDLEAARRALEDLTARRSQLQARLEELKNREAGQKGKLESVEQGLALAESEMEKAGRELEKLEDLRQLAEKAVGKGEAELLAAQRQLAGFESDMKKVQAERAEQATLQARVQAQLDVLEQAEQSFSGYAEGARLLLEAARQARLSTTHGAFSSVLDVPSDLEIAIAAALGESADAVVFTSGRDVEQALVLLDSDQSARAALLPLDWLNPPESLKVKKDRDCLGVASELVEAPPELQPAVDLLLGQVIVVQDRTSARRVLAGQPGQVRAVTLRGELFHATGQVIAGKAARPASLSRPRQRRELQQSLAGLGKTLARFDKDIGLLARKLDSSRETVAGLEQGLTKLRAGLEEARKNERQIQVRAESARKQRDWQIEQLTAFQKEIGQAGEEYAPVSRELAGNEARLAELQIQVREISAKLAGLTLEEHQEQVGLWKTRTAVAERALQDVLVRRGEREKVCTSLEQQQQGLENRLVEIDQALSELESDREKLRQQTSAMNSQLEELRDLIEPAEKELETTEVQEGELQKQETEGQTGLARVERIYNQLQLDLGRKQEALENLRQKIEDDFGLVAFDYTTPIDGPVPLPFDGMVEQLPVVTVLPSDLEENLTRQRAQLRRMGSVNPEAQEEYRAVKERFTFLTTQMSDLRKAEADLHQVIAELDELTRRDFQKTFDAVAEQFHTIFHRLFGGGAARLTLTDPDNLTDTGIDIEARLPGRREQGLSLLSGGERSLTAIALVFALLKVSPTPVCVMDEVDAMLDEANVGRFRDLLSELSQQTQFIIITHNRNTVQAADVIYGVTMGRDTSSQIISLKLDEVSEEYLK